MIGWLRRVFCRHDWLHEREGRTRTWTCKKCGEFRFFIELPVPSRTRPLRNVVSPLVPPPPQDPK